MMRSSLVSIIGEACLSNASLIDFHVAMARAGYTAVTDVTAVDWLRRYEAWYRSWSLAQARGIDVEEFTV